MADWTDALIVSLIAIGTVVLLGVLGFFADQCGEPAEHKPEREPGR